jgi:hypothetical protein
VRFKSFHLKKGALKSKADSIHSISITGPLIQIPRPLRRRYRPATIEYREQAMVGGRYAKRPGVTPAFPFAEKRGVGKSGKRVTH